MLDELQRKPEYRNGGVFQEVGMSLRSDTNNQLTKRTFKGTWVKAPPHLSHLAKVVSGECSWFD